MLTLGLKLIGIGKFLRDFFLQNWKWLVPVLLLVAGFLWTKNHYYDLGRQEEKLAWESRIKVEQEKNKRLTELLETSVVSFGETLQKEETERVSKEVIRENRINTIIQEKPIYQECKIDQEVLDEQNALKALGPTP